MSKILAPLVLVSTVLLLAGCGGGGGGKSAPGPQAKGQLQFVNNVPANIVEIALRPSGSSQAMQKRFDGLVAVGATYTLSVDPGTYDIDVVIQQTSTSQRGTVHYVKIPVGAGELRTVQLQMPPLP